MPGPLQVIDFSGRYHTEPSTRTSVEVVGARRVALGNPFIPVILGRFPAGALDTVHEFRDQSEFARTHDPEGTAVDASAVVGRYVFQPGTTLAGPPGGPGTVRTIRVGQGAQSPTAASYSFVDASPEAVLVATSIDRGLIPNRLRVKVSAGTDGSGVKLAVGFRDQPAWVKVGDRLGELFTLDYTGNATAATVTLTRASDKSTRLQIALTDPSDGSASLDIDLTSPAFATVQQVVDYIARQPNYVATPKVSDVSLRDIPSYEIDPPGALELIEDGATTITAKLGAIIAWARVNCTQIGPVPGVTLARVATKTAAPAAMAAFAFLAGGTQPAVIAADWDAALAVLVREEIESGIIVLDTADASVQAQVTAWIDSQLTINGRIWRAVYGLPDATTAAAARAYAAKIDSQRIAVTHQRLLALTTPTTTRSPIYAAAALAGATGGINFDLDPQSAVLTSRRFRFGGILAADKQDKTTRESSINAGVMVWREARGGRVLLSLNRSTYLERGAADDRFKMLWSEAVVLDAIAISIESALEPLQVAWATRDYIASVRDEVVQVLRAWERRGFISAGTDATGVAYPAYSAPIVEVFDGKTDITFELGMIGETDHLRIRAVIRRLALTTEA